MTARTLPRNFLSVDGEALVSHNCLSIGSASMNESSQEAVGHGIGADRHRTKDFGFCLGGFLEDLIDDVASAS